MGAAALGGFTTVTLAGCAGEAVDADTFTAATSGGPDVTDYTAIVIGTGYGGAVSALRLAEAGVDTLMIEMGKLWDTPGPDGHVHCNMDKPDGRAMWFKETTEAPISEFLRLSVVNKKIDKYPGALDRLQFENMSVYVGRGVGGGSLVNGGMAVVPRRDFFSGILPGVDADSMYETFYPRAMKTLRTSTIPENLLEKSDFYQYTRVARDQAHAAGFKSMVVPNVYDYDYMQQEELGTVHRSAFGNELLYGNNAGKRSVNKTYIAEALGTGKVTLKYLHRVDAITQDSATGRYVISTTLLDNSGETDQKRTFTCKHLIVAAGSVGTTEILLRARETGALPNLNLKVGQGWGNNGNVMLARANHIWAPTGTKQATPPAVGIDGWDHPTHPAFAEIAALPIGFETWISMYLTLTRTGERGYFVYDSATNKAILKWGSDQNAIAVQGAKFMFDKINAKHLTVYRNDLFGGGKVFGDDFTYHPLGGCVLGQATDLFGRVDGYENLYVNDAALIPGSTQANPFLTITALAERNIETIIRENVLRS
jgi:cholesterol oxidase